MSARTAGSSRAGALSLVLLLLVVSAVDSLFSQTQSTSEQVRKMVSGNGTGQSGLPGHTTTVIKRANERYRVDVDNVKRLQPQTNEMKTITVQPITISPANETGPARGELQDKREEKGAGDLKHIDIEAPRELSHSATTVTVSIHLEPFGVVQFYSLVVTEDPRNDTAAVMSWNEVQALDVWPPYEVPVRFHEYTLSFVEFIIGEGYCDYRGYCNGLLKPGTKYYVKLRAHDHSFDNFIDSSYTVVHTAARHIELQAPRELGHSATSVTVSIRLEPIEKLPHYVLVITEDPRKPTSALVSWHRLQKMYVWPPYEVPLMVKGNKSSVEEFIIGGEYCNGTGGFYCNGPLKPNTKYYVKLRVYTPIKLTNSTQHSDNVFTDSAYTEVYTSGAVLDDWKLQPPYELRRSSTTVTVSFLLGFSHPRPFAFTTLVVAEDPRNDMSAPLPSWYDVRALGVWPPYQVPVRNYWKNSSSFEEFVIGSEDCDADGSSYCNGPLKPGSKYYVKLRVYTGTYNFTDSNYTVVYTDEISGGNTNITVILILITFITSLFLLVVFALRKRCWLKYNEPNTTRLTKCEVRNPFYLNLLFRKECRREIAEIEGMQYDEVEGYEHIYEEIIYEEIDCGKSIRRNSFDNIIVPPVTDSEINGDIYEDTYELKPQGSLNMASRNQSFRRDSNTYDYATTTIGQLPGPDTTPVETKDPPISMEVCGTVTLDNAPAQPSCSYVNVTSSTSLPQAFEQRVTQPASTQSIYEGIMTTSMQRTRVIGLYPRPLSSISTSSATLAQHAAPSADQLEEP